MLLNAQNGRHSPLFRLSMSSLFPFLKMNLKKFFTSIARCFCSPTPQAPQSYEEEDIQRSLRTLSSLNAFKKSKRSLRNFESRRLFVDYRIVVPLEAREILSGRCKLPREFRNKYKVSEFLDATENSIIMGGINRHTKEKVRLALIMCRWRSSSKA